MPDKIKEMESTLELVFGYGKYQFLGKNLALMELNKIFVEVSVIYSSSNNGSIMYVLI